MVIGVMFKIMHWPGGVWPLILGPSAIVTFYLLRFLAKTEKTKLDYAKLALVVSFCTRFIIYVFHFPGKAVVSGVFLISFGFFVALLIDPPFFQDKKNMDVSSPPINNKVLLKNIIVIIGIFAIVFGSIFKIMHWPGASILLIVGLIIIAGWAIIDLLLTKD